MRDVRQTRAKIQHLTALGYRVKEMWECEWQHMIQSDNHLKEFVETLDIVTPLNPREAFFGGRTNAIKLHHKVEENEQIHYSDIILLHPCANLECEYPIGHPEFINQPKTTDISRYYGLVKCKNFTPQLYHPVLPYRYNSKLLFPLCRTCAQQQIKQQPTNNKRKVKPALIPLRNGPSQVSGPPSNFKRPLKRIMSSPMCTKYGISSNVQRNSFNHT